MGKRYDPTIDEETELEKQIRLSQEESEISAPKDETDMEYQADEPKRTRKQKVVDWWDSLDLNPLDDEGTIGKPLKSVTDYTDKFPKVRDGKLYSDQKEVDKAFSAPEAPSVAANVTKAKTETDQAPAPANNPPPEKEEDDLGDGAPKTADRDTLDGLIKHAQSSKDLVPDLVKYEKEMRAFDKELADKEAGLAKGFKDKVADERLSSYMIKGIELAAQMFAAHRGVKSKLSAPLDTGDKERMERLERELVSNQRILRSRISQSKSLLGDIYSKKERKANRVERAEDKAANLEARKKARDIEIMRVRQNQGTAYDDAVRAKAQRLQFQFGRLKESKRLEFLTTLGMTETAGKKLLGERDWWLDDDPDLAGIRDYLETTAIASVTRPEPRKTSAELEAEAKGEMVVTPTAPKTETGRRYNKQGNYTEVTYSDGSTSKFDGRVLK
jgi:hypothetical protein